MAGVTVLPRYGRRMQYSVESTIDHAAAVDARELGYRTLGCGQTNSIRACIAPAALPISGSSHHILEQTQGETRRPGTISIQLSA